MYLSSFKMIVRPMLGTLILQLHGLYTDWLSIVFVWLVTSGALEHWNKQELPQISQRTHVV
jgi:hypothetical protein